MALQGLPQKNLHQFILWKMASSRMLVLQVGEWMQMCGKSALMHIARLMNSLTKGLKRMVTKVQWLCWKLHDNWVAYFKIWSRRSLHRFCGRAQTYWSQSDVFDCPGDPPQRNPNAPKFEDRSQERRNGKNDVPVKQRRSWPKIS